MAETVEGSRASFESIKHINPYGAEYWSARELMPLLGYDKWQRFHDAIERGRAACVNAGEQIDDHFTGSGKMIDIGKGAQREVQDYALSRFGCYLVAMNGDPRKPEIAVAQTYFAVQTRRAERWDELREAVDERIHLREELGEANKRLNAVAQARGVNSRSFGRLHDAGARGLYGGLSVQDVKVRKGIGPREDFADRMGRAELAANYFVRTQTEEKIVHEEIQGQEAVIGAHYEVGAQTRALIDRIGSTRPEDLPAEPSIRPLLDQRARQRARLVPQEGPSLFDPMPPPQSLRTEPDAD